MHKTKLPKFEKTREKYKQKKSFDIVKLAISPKFILSSTIEILIILSSVYIIEWMQNYD